MSSQQPIDLTEVPTEYIVSFHAHAYDVELLKALINDVITAYGVPTDGLVIVTAADHEQFGRILDDLFADEALDMED